ncbi:MAG: CDP-glucose 4,6-dehydratase [Alphaproteobacteria bacterium]|nr:CDP-glucose 4,6-dehydratase [Alphaproteobacteria bacterium]
MGMSFWRNRKVFLTGHTGFKGAWMALMLAEWGAEVTGYALPPEGARHLYGNLFPLEGCHSIFGDIMDVPALRKAVSDYQPEIVIHMAAQAIVRRSYREPLQTFEANVMGTLNVLAAAQACPSVKLVLAITSDKVYHNPDTGVPFKESDPLGGDDPYSASKAACEIAVASWRKSFAGKGPIVLTARGGNVIGGGDWAEDRLVPDVFRAWEKGEPVELRYPESTRPWQHVLDVDAGYLHYIATAIERKGDVPPNLNLGPENEQPLPARVVVETLASYWHDAPGWRKGEAPALPEKKALALDVSLARESIGWRPRYTAAEALRHTAAWYSAAHDGEEMKRFSRQQIHAYFENNKKMTA